MGSCIYDSCIIIFVSPYFPALLIVIKIFPSSFFFFFSRPASVYILDTTSGAGSWEITSVKIKSSGVYVYR